MPGANAGSWNQQLRRDDGSADGEVMAGAGALATPFETIGYEVGDLDMFGVYLNPSANTGTVAMNVQESFDGGSTWTDTYPAVENSETNAAIGDVTADIHKQWPSFHPSAAAPESVDENASPREFGNRPMIRLAFTGGTDITFADARLVAKTFSLRGR